MEDYKRQTSGGYVQIPVSDRTVTDELSGDFTLPDYQPEIKRLLRITASVLPPSKYIGDNEAEFAGNVDYYVLYTGSDNEVYCAPLTTEYKIDVPVDQDSGLRLSNLTGSAEIVPDMISGRVTSPRKLNIKCRLKTRAQIFGDMTFDDSFSNQSDGENQVLHGEQTVSRALFGSGEVLRLSDEIIIDNKEGEARVISADGKALMSEVGCSAGLVNCRGDLYLKLLMGRENTGDTYTVTRKMPFSQSVVVDGVDSQSSASAQAVVTEMNINVEDGRVCIDVGMIIDAAANKSEDVTYIKDVYSTSHRTDCRYKTVTPRGIANAFVGNFTLSDSMSLEEAGISPECSVSDVMGTVFSEEISFEGGKCSVSGKAKFNMLLKRDGEYSCSDVELPFRYSTDTNMQAENAGAMVSGEVISARARIDGERIGIDSEISMCGNMWHNCDIKLLDDVDFGEELKFSRGEYVVCYPSRDDTLWSVAKRYGATISSLSQNNKISASDSPDSSDSLDGINYLII